MKLVARLGLLALVVQLAVSAQTLERAEDLWRARDFTSANLAFRALVAQHPEHLEYKVLWGRMFMDHGDQDDVGNASDIFKEVLQVDKNNAGALLGLALMAADVYDGGAEKLARAAIEADPKLLEAQELLARLGLEDNNDSKATAEARKALAIDPHSVVAKAILASIDWLNGKAETSWDPHAALGYSTAAHFFMLNRRYDEAIQYYRKAIDLDPNLWKARSELGINLMRLGQTDEAMQQLADCFHHGQQDMATKNVLKLLDKYVNFVATKSNLTVLKLNKNEAGLLRPYFQAEIDRVIATYEKKYKIKLDRPVQVEAYPNHDDFAVRTLGLPGLGALGVTFTSRTYGSTIALDSPSGRKPGAFHWDSTLWHEMSHVFTLTITNSLVPRWFTEGIAVHEETAANPEWGDRITPEILMAVKERQLLPVADLDRGFVHPVNPVQVIVSYYQAGRICDFITEKWGWDTILSMLHDFASQTDTATVIRKELGIEPADFDNQIRSLIEAENKNTIEHFDQWRASLKQIAAADKAKDYDTVIKLGSAARDLYPDYVEDGNVYEFLANAYLAKNDKPAAIAELERYMKIGGRNPDTLNRLATQLTAAGNRQEAAASLDRINYIYPMDDGTHTKLGALWLDLQNAPGAIREFQAVVGHNPADPAQAHYDLARAYHLNHQDSLAIDELLSSLEAAPGFRAAQKLLLELSGGENETAAAPLKKRE
ncbi:MAG: tetratricopeptide repeat protein [Bryobacteraceae bacterium]